MLNAVVASREFFFFFFTRFFFDRFDIETFKSFWPADPVSVNLATST